MTIVIVHCEKCEHSTLKPYGIRVCDLRNEVVNDDDTCLIREAKLRAWYGRVERLDNYVFPANKILEVC